jgi:hypothetical protein
MAIKDPRMRRAPEGALAGIGTESVLRESRRYGRDPSVPFQTERLHYTSSYLSNINLLNKNKDSLLVH